MKITILAILPGIFPSTELCIIKPMLALQKKGIVTFKVALTQTFCAQLLNKVDLVIFCRNADTQDLLILNQVIEKKIPYIYDVDDNFFAISPTTPLGKVYRHPVSLFALTTLLENASLVRVYSQAMMNRCLPYQNKIELVKSYFDFSLIDQLNRTLHKKCKIVYATSRRTDDHLQNLFLSALKKMLQKYAHVELHIYGSHLTDPWFNENKAVVQHTQSLPYKKFIPLFFKASYDIGLAPMYDDEFHNSKTNNKYREYGACGIAGIYSATPLYNACIHNKENGLLVENTEEAWLEALELLITNESLRQIIIKNAHKDVHYHYSFNSFCAQWKTHIDSILDKKSLLTEKSSSKNIAFPIIYCKEFLSPVANTFFSYFFKSGAFQVLTYTDAYQAGFRNFITLIENADSRKLLDTFIFHDDAKYWVLDYAGSSKPAYIKNNAHWSALQGNKTALNDENELYADINNNPLFFELNQVLKNHFMKNCIASTQQQKSFLLLTKIITLIKKIYAARSNLKSKAINYILPNIKLRYTIFKINNLKKM